MFGRSGVRAVSRIVRQVNRVRAAGSGFVGVPYTLGLLDYEPLLRFSGVIQYDGYMLWTSRAHGGN